MHEFSVATDIIENAIEEAKKHNATRIKEITLEIGKLAMINPDQMKFALELLSGETIAEGADIILKVLPLRVKCAKKHINEIDELDIERVSMACAVSMSDILAEILRMNGQCSDCYWAFRSLLEFYFCNCHERYEEYVKKYRASILCF